MIQRENFKPHWWPVKVLPEEEKKLIELGKARNQNGQQMGWTSRTPSLDNKFHVLGLAGEWATAMVFNEPVGTITSRNAKFLNDVGDVGGFIEVRTSTKPGIENWDLGGFEDHIKPQRAYVHCLGHLWPEYIVLSGWAWGHEILKSPKTRIARHQPGKLIKFMEQGQLKNIVSLFDELRQRKPHKWNLQARDFFKT